MVEAQLSERADTRARAMLHAHVRYSEGGRDQRGWHERKRKQLDHQERRYEYEHQYQYNWYGRNIKTKFRTNSNAMATIRARVTSITTERRANKR